jgi:hypothetical protein
LLLAPGNIFEPQVTTRGTLSASKFFGSPSVTMTSISELATHGRKILGPHVGRQKGEPSRDAVELDQSKSSGELFGSRYEDRTAFKLAKIGAQARTILQVGEGCACIKRPEMAIAA